MLREFSGQYEDVIADRLTVAFEAYFRTLDFGTSYEATAFGIASGQRWYVQSEAPNGFYLGTRSYLERVSFERQNAGGTDDPGTATILGMTGESGYQWVMDNGLVLDMGGSLRWPWLVDTFNSKAEPPVDMKNTTVAFFLSTGYAW